MPILNYTTTIDPSKTVGEISGKLAKFGAANISVDYEDGNPVALAFVIKINSDFVSYRLPSNYEGVHKALVREGLQAKYQTQEHALKVAWRILKDWVEAQLAVVESGLSEMTEVFLPYVLAPDGRTLYQIAKAQGVKGLLKGSDRHD